MEKEIKERVISERVKHQFFCDKCGAFLGETQEAGDGYYGRLGEFEQKFRICGRAWYDKGETYVLNKCYCDGCREEMVNEIRNALISLGFERE